MHFLVDLLIWVVSEAHSEPILNLCLVLLKDSLKPNNNMKQRFCTNQRYRVFHQASVISYTLRLNSNSVAPSRLIF